MNFGGSKCGGEGHPCLLQWGQDHPFLPTETVTVLSGGLLKAGAGLRTSVYLSTRQTFAGLATRPASPP